MRHRHPCRLSAQRSWMERRTEMLRARQRRQQPGVPKNEVDASGEGCGVLRADVEGTGVFYILSRSPSHRVMCVCNPTCIPYVRVSKLISSFMLYVIIHFSSSPSSFHLSNSPSLPHSCSSSSPAWGLRICRLALCGPRTLLSAPDSSPLAPA